MYPGWQPCPACGTLEVGPDGRCARCGLQRVIPAHPQPQAGMPAPAGGSQRVHVWVIAGLTVLVAAAMATVAVVALRDRGPQPAVTPGPSGTASGGPTPSGSIDQCLIGTWRETDRSALRAYGSVFVTVSSAGAVQQFTPEGVAVLNHGSGVTESGTLGGRTYRATVVGRLTWTYTTRSQQIFYTSPSGGLEITLKVDNGEPQVLQQQATGLDPEGYTCVGDELRQFGTGYSVSLMRVSTAT